MGMSILVIEDDPELLEGLSELLESEGHQVRRARHGLEALGFLRAGQRPHLILLDLMMPEMDGFELFELLRGDAAFSNIPVVVMTTTDLSEADRRRLNSGIVEFVSKAACDRDELLARIRDFVMHNVPISGMQRQVERDG